METNRSLLDLIRTERKIQVILFLGFLVQVITAITAVGAYHPDQHFAVVEYGMRYLGLPSSAEVLWDFEEKMLPSIKMFLFMGYYKAVSFLGMQDRYHILTLLRVACGLAHLVLFSYIVWKQLRGYGHFILLTGLFILHFSWWFPFIRASYSAEMVSSLLFFGAIALFLHGNEKKPVSLVKGMFIGFILSLAFFARFQIAFAGIGFIIWLIWTQKKSLRSLEFMFLGFLPGLALNTWMDTLYYGELVSTPINYFQANIIEGRAASFGTEPVTFYLAILAVVLLAPLLSPVLLGVSIRGMWKRFKDPYVLCVLVFLLAHFAVSHKEDRFLFPVFGVLPVLVGYGLVGFQAWFARWGLFWKWVFGLIAGFSLLLNFFALGFFMLTPYSQGIHFMELIDRYFQDQKEPITVYCHIRNPFQSSSRIPLAWYNSNLNEQVRFETRDSLSALLEIIPEGEEVYLATTYNQLHRDPEGAQRSGEWVPVFYSSPTIWRVNEWLAEQRINTINEIWVLYKLSPRQEEASPPDASNM
jgi:phosphatidylinositol glycan class B